MAPLRRLIPPLPVARRLVRTAALVWLAARLLGAVLGVMVLTPVAAAAFAGVVLLLTWLDLSGTRERILYANLGIHPVAISAIVLTVVASLEVLVGLAIAALGGIGPVEPPF